MRNPASRCYDAGEVRQLIPESRISLPLAGVCLVIAALCSYVGALSIQRGRGAEKVRAYRTLEKTKAPFEAAFSSTGPDFYRFPLDAGEFAQVQFECGGIRSRATIHGPDGKALAESYCSAGRRAPLSVIALAEGEHSLEIVPIDRVDSNARYRVWIAVSRLSERRDEARIEAESLLAQAERLRFKGTAPAKAIKKYWEAFELWQTISAPEAVFCLLMAGQLHQVQGDSVEAIEHAQRALDISRRADYPRGERETLADLCFFQAFSGNIQRAEAYCDQALELSRAGKDDRGAAQAMTSWGVVHYLKGDLLTAQTYLSQALRLWRSVADRRGEAFTLTYLGALNSDWSRIKRAAELLNEALGLWTALQDERGRALALANLAHLYSRTGKKRQAISNYLEARDLFRRTGDVIGEGMTFNGLGAAYDALGDQRGAIGQYEQGLALYQRANLRQGVAGMLWKIGDCDFAIGNNSKALQKYQQALALLRELGSRRIESLVARSLGMVHASLGEDEEARLSFQQALSLHRTLSDPRGEAATLNAVGEFYENRGESTIALNNYSQALQLAIAAEDRFEESETLYNIARLESSRGRLLQAKRRLEAALEIDESLRDRVSGEPLRISHFASIRQHHELYIDLLMRLDERDSGEGFHVGGFEASERFRARSLVESLGIGKRRAKVRPNTALMRQRESVEERLSATLERARLFENPENRQDELKLAEDIRQLRRMHRELEEKIQSDAAALDIEPAQSKRLELKDIQQLLDQHTLLVEISLGDRQSYMWAVSAQDFQAYKLPPRDEINKAAERVRQLLTAREPRMNESIRQQRARIEQAERLYWPEASALSSLLLGPIKGRLGHKRLVFVPDGALHYLPFGALPVPSGGARIPLIAEHEIVRLPSASTLIMLRQASASRSQSQKGIAVLADPVFEANDPRLAREYRRTQAVANSPGSLGQTLRGFSLTRNAGGIPRLPLTHREAKSIKKLAGQESVLTALGFDANRSFAISGELARYRVIHFATHGLLDDQYPELTGLFLSFFDKRGQRQRGVLSLQDIYDLHLPAELVVLSACSTGLGENVKGEGLLGMVRGFMQSGTKRLVASLWKVDDVATAELMERFYQGMLNGGLSPAAALREAQLAMRQSKRWRSPFYWSAFVIAGDWRRF